MKRFASNAFDGAVFRSFTFTTYTFVVVVNKGLRHLWKTGVFADASSTCENHNRMVLAGATDMTSGQLNWHFNSSRRYPEITHNEIALLYTTYPQRVLNNLGVLFFSVA